jgi:RNA polymerase sigma factor (sigma-70 family)
MTTDSQTLLAQYIQHGSEEVFRELVARYVDLVYSTALRLVEGDSHRAKDVSQIVFVDLASKARTFSSDIKLGGWLHRHTCFVAANTLRGERRRQFRERQAVEMNALHDDAGTNFAAVAPLLDEAIDELNETDREAILLRFFEQQDFRAVGKAIGQSEDAARMKVNRALEKLEALLKQRGLTTTAAALFVALSVNAVQAAPIGLAVTFSTAAFAGTAISTTTVLTATKTIAMITLQKTLITATIAVAVGVGIYEANRAAALQRELHILEKSSAEQAHQLRQERDDAANQLAQLRTDNERLNRNTSELLKLRGEVGGLRRQASPVVLQAENNKLKTALAEAQESVELVFQARRSATVNDLKQLGLAIRMYASDNKDVVATNFDQIRSLIDIKTNAQGILTFPSGNELEGFEFVNAGLLNLTNKTMSEKVFFREKVARKTPDGKWQRAYCLVDGSVQTITTDDGNFDAWESEHLVAPSP